MPAIFAKPATMGSTHFIARRILGDADREDRLSRPIVLIAVLGIVIGMAVMIVTVSITSGFQREIMAKVTGIGAHIQITSISQSDPKETPRVEIDQPFYPYLDTVPGVEHIQIHATKPGIIETDDEIEGVIVKGVGADHDWRFLERHLTSGRVLRIGGNERENDMLISHYLAERLGIALSDTITVYLVKGREDIRPRKFRVVGVYQTGLEQFDHQVVFVDIAHLQRFSQWGLQAEMLVADSSHEGRVRVEGLAFGGDRVYTYRWPGTDLKGKGPFMVHVPEHGDTLLTLVVSDADRTLPDTAWVRLSHANGAPDQGTGTDRPVEVERGGSGGSHSRYCGGFEVTISDFDRLTEMDDLIHGRYLDIRLRSRSVKDRYPEIFSWLELLDTNVIVVIVLMVLVAIINMTSALLIIILERTNMIGVLKALGSTNGLIRRIFLIDAAYILGIGVLLGDLLGIGLCLVQHHTGIVTLPLESYYVSSVPVAIDPFAILLLNVGTLIVCLAALVLPSMLVSRIAPARAIRYA